jgi:hypothetical protein
VGVALAKLVLQQIGINIKAYTSQVGNIKLDDSYLCYDLDSAEQNPVRCPDQEKAAEMEEKLRKNKFDLNDLLEQMQQADGSVIIPEVLRPFMGGISVLKPIKK